MILRNLKYLFYEFLANVDVFEEFKIKSDDKKILLIGDGISQKYLSSIINDYEYIGCCNTSIWRRLINQRELLFYTQVDSSLFLPPSLRKSLVPKKWEDSYSYNDYLLSYSLRTKVKYRIYHALGKLFAKDIFRKNSKNVFLPMYRNYFRKRKYDQIHFGGTFDSALYVALSLGFKKIHLIGFDAFTLKESVNSRWFESSDNLKIYDILNSKINRNIELHQSLKEAIKYSEITTYLCKGQEPISEQIKTIFLNIKYEDLKKIDIFSEEIDDEKCKFLIDKYSKRLLQDFIDKYY